MKRIKIRRKWNFNPTTRVKDSNKKYKRQKQKKEVKETLEDSLLF